MIRTILALIFVFLFLILGIPVLFVEWIIGKFNKPAADLSSLRIVQWAFRVILFICGTKITVIGEENVPKDTPVLYIGNHRSYFDIIITYARCPGLTGYVAKDNIARVPLLSHWMRRLYCLFLNRTDVKEGLKTILTGVDQIKTEFPCAFSGGYQEAKARTSWICFRLKPEASRWRKRPDVQSFRWRLSAPPTFWRTIFQASARPMWCCSMGSRSS